MSEIISQHLSTNGDGTGTTAIVADYSSAAQEFSIDAPAGEVFLLSRAIITIQDAGVIRAQDYGSIADGLTNGLTLEKVGDPGGATLLSLTNGHTIKTNAEWAHYCHDVELRAWGGGDNVINIRWTFSKSGEPLKLMGDESQRLVLTANDNFVTLDDHAVVIQGIRMSEDEWKRRFGF